MKNMSKTALLLAVLFIGLLGGCTSDGAVNVSGSGGGAELREFTLKDGTPCAAIVGYNKAAISCGWRQLPPTEL